MSDYPDAAQIAASCAGYYPRVERRLPNGNWKGNGGSMLYCFCCQNLVRSSHHFTCPNYGIEDESKKEPCNCNVRVKTVMIPICRTCNDDNIKLCSLLFNEEQIKNGMLYTLNMRKHFYVLYSFIQIKKVIPRNVSTNSICTEISRAHDSSFDSSSSSFLQGFDVKKQEFCFCPLCGYMMMYPCLTMTVRDQRTTHIESVSTCNNGMCQQPTMIRIRFWSVIWENLIDNSELNIKRTITDTDELFDNNSIYDQLNDYKKNRNKYFEQRQYEYPETWFSTNKNGDSIFMSTLELTRMLKMTNVNKIKINSTQEEMSIINNGLGLISNILYTNNEFIPCRTVIDKSISRDSNQITPTAGINDTDEMEGITEMDEDTEDTQEFKSFKKFKKETTPNEIKRFKDIKDRNIVNDSPLSF